MEEFRIYHNKSTLYHLQANGIVDEYNNILKTALTKVCNVQHDNWDQIIPAVLWVYRATQKKTDRSHTVQIGIQEGSNNSHGIYYSQFKGFYYDKFDGEGCITKMLTRVNGAWR